MLGDRRLAAPTSSPMTGRHTHELEFRSNKSPSRVSRPLGERIILADNKIHKNLRRACSEIFALKPLSTVPVTRRGLSPMASPPSVP
jgi:hypothetical protein